MVPQPAATSTWWQGKSPADYVMYWSVCAKAKPGPDGMFYNYLPVAKGQQPPDPPPDPTAIARSAMATFHYPTMKPQFGPDPTRVAVTLPVSLYVNDPGVLSDSATDRGLTVKISAAITHLAFDMGEPGRATVECAGLGSPPDSRPNPADPECGFTYSLRSLPDRTHGVGNWPISVTTTWTVTWSASNGQAGTLTTDRVFSDSALYVGEYRTVMVPPR